MKLIALFAVVLAAAKPLPALPPEYAKTFTGRHYADITTVHIVLLYRRWGGCSRQLGGYWSRTRFVTASAAERALALPPCNTAVHLTVIRVPRGTAFYEGKAAPMFRERGGGDQVLFPATTRVPARWIVRR